MNDDNETLDEITDAFTRALIKYKFNDIKKYIDLARRLASLIDCEIAWRAEYGTTLGEYINERRKESWSEFEEIVKKNFPNYRIQSPVEDDQETDNQNSKEL